MLRRFILSSIILCASCSMYSQSERINIRMGNKLFRQQSYAKSEVDYRKALSENGKNSQALYNLGCALMAQQKDSDAVDYLKKAGKCETNPIRKAMVYHNIGVIFQRHQMFNDAVKAYAESLRNNCNDNETRYNLALCKRQQKNQNNQNNQDKNKNDKNKNKDNNKDKNKQDEKQNSDQKKQQRNKTMNKENAEQLLNAAIQEEKNTQQRLQKRMQQSRSRKLEKNW